MSNLAFPYRFDSKNRTSSHTKEAHIRSLIEQVLFTAPGERLNRPDFGSGLLEMVFAPNSDILAESTQLTVEAALHHWLGDLIDLEGVTVTAEETELHVEVRYYIRPSQEVTVSEFKRGRG